MMVHGQCPATTCDYSVTGGSGTYNLNSGDTLCIVSGSFNGTVNMSGGVVVICSNSNQGFIVNWASPGGKIFHYGSGTWNTVSSSYLFNAEIHNYGHINHTSGSQFENNSRLFNYGTFSCPGFGMVGNSEVHNFGTISLPSGQFENNAPGGYLYNYNSGTISTDKLLLHHDSYNSGSMSGSTECKFETGSVTNNDGGCFSCGSFINNGNINGLTCGTISISGSSSNYGNINAPLAIVDPSVGSHPWVDLNSGSVQATVIGTSCGCPGAIADLALDLEVVDIETPVDSTVVYSITVENLGSSNASGVQVTSAIPSGFTFVEAKGDGTYNAGTGIWDIGAIPVNEAVIINFIAIVNSSGSYQIDSEITSMNETDPDSDPSISFGTDDLSDSIADDDEDSLTLIPTPIDDCNDRMQYAALNLTGAAVSPFPTMPITGGFLQTFPTGTENFSFTFDNSFITGDSIISPDWAGTGTLNFTMNDANVTSGASHSWTNRVTEYHDWAPGVKPNATENVYRVFGRGIFSFNSGSAPLPHDYDLFFDFTSLDGGYLPAGTILGFTDIDGTGTGEVITLTSTPASGPNDAWLTFFDYTVDPVDPAGLVTYDPIAHSYVLDGPATSNESVAYVTSVDLNSININVYNDGSSIGLKLAAPMIKAPAISIDDVTVNENAGNAVFTVSIDCTNTFDVDFDYATTGGTATEGTDYTATSGTGTITAGTTTTTITVPLTNDALDENDETFVIDLSNPVNAIITDAQGSGTIQDDDPLPTLTVVAGTFAETVGFASFDVNLSAMSGRDVTFSYASTEYTAEEPADFVSTSGSHLMLAGNTTWTFWVPIIDDVVYEGTEGIFTTISSPTNATIAVVQDTLWITDDEVQPCFPHPLVHLKADVGFSSPTWSDQGPHGNDGTVFGNPTSVPESMNFNPGISFDGDDYIEIDLPELKFEGDSNHIMIFCVYKPSTASTAIGIYGNQGSNLANINFYDGKFSNGITNIATSWPYGTDPHLLTFKIDEENNVEGGTLKSRIWNEGVNTSGTTFNETNEAGVDTKFFLGRSGSNASSQYFQGEIYELMIYYENNGSLSLTDAQRLQVQSYLALKYGITLNHDYTDSQ